jgi:plastocyanin
VIRALAFLLGSTALLPAAHAAELHARVLDEQGRVLSDAVVIAVSEVPAPAARPRIEQIEQIDLEFVPRVKAIQAGSSISFPNRDDVRHHVYSFSQPKRFELPLYVGTPAQPVRFDTPGVVTIGCNIHDWMVGYIYVADSPYYGMTGAEGGTRLTGLPAGRYTVRVWHPQLAQPEESTRREVDLRAAPNAELEWRLALKPARRVPRALVPGQGGRY